MYAAYPEAYASEEKHGIVELSKPSILKAKTIWTDEMIAVLVSRYPTETAKSIASDLSVSLLTVYRKACALGLKKTVEYNATEISGRLVKGGRSDGRGAATRFKKGQEAWNKGVTGYMGANTTSFVSGRLPHNTKHDGAERLRADGYIYVRVSLAKWRLKHRVVWEEAFGEIPKGHCVVFRDGNPDNCVSGNLELINRAENQRRNSIHNYPAEMKQDIRLLRKLERTIKKRKDGN